MNDQSLLRISSFEQVVLPKLKPSWRILMDLGFLQTEWNLLPYRRNPESVFPLVSFPLPASPFAFPLVSGCIVLPCTNTSHFHSLRARPSHYLSCLRTGERLRYHLKEFSVANGVSNAKELFNLKHSVLVS